MEFEVSTYDGGDGNNAQITRGGETQSVAYLEPNTWGRTQELPLVSDYSFDVEVSKSGNIYLNISLSVSN